MYVYQSYLQVRISSCWSSPSFVCLQVKHAGSTVPKGLTPPLDPNDPFADDDRERREVEELARKFENKYVSVPLRYECIIVPAVTVLKCIYWFEMFALRVEAAPRRRRRRTGCRTSSTSDTATTRPTLSSTIQRRWVPFSDKVHTHHFVHMSSLLFPKNLFFFRFKFLKKWFLFSAESSVALFKHTSSDFEFVKWW